jgi:hypothetical protein
VDLNSAETIVNIVTAVIAAVSALLAMLGKLRLRLPTQLSTVEARGFLVLGTFIVALPILAWGLPGGLTPALANLMVVPGLPAYLERNWDRPQEEVTVRDGILYLVLLALAVVNFFALVSLIPDQS